MSTTKRTRAENRAWMEAEILRLGREQLADRGPAALSLREIARDLGVASSAVYRYVADRDALLTLLVVDAYTALADHVEAALETAHEGDLPVHVLARAMRGWATAHPAGWGLIYGTPVPGYDAPADQTTDPGVRLMIRLGRLMAGSDVAGIDPPADFRGFLEGAARELQLELSPAELAAGIEAWCAIVGTISMEVFGQLGRNGAAYGGALLDQTCDRIAGRLPSTR
ncbi:TetR/AcrR family transcriptional regulator [Calidifontibacter terrae]